MVIKLLLMAFGKIGGLKLVSTDRYDTIKKKSLCKASRPYCTTPSFQIIHTELKALQSGSRNMFLTYEQR